MSSPAIVWSEEVVGVRIDSPRHALVEEVDLDAYKTWTSILVARHEEASRLSKSVSDQDTILDSPTWLTARLDDLRSRRFRRINAPRRKHR